MSKKAEEAALKAYPKMSCLSEPHGIIPANPRTRNLGDANEENRTAFKLGYEQAQRDIAKALLMKYKEESDKCPDADYDHEYTVAETQQCGRFMMMEDIYEKFCEPVGVTLDDLEEEK